MSGDLRLTGAGAVELLTAETSYRFNNKTWGEIRRAIYVEHLRQMERHWQLRTKQRKRQRL